MREPIRANPFSFSVAAAAYRQDMLIYSVSPDMSLLAPGDLLIHDDFIPELPQDLIALDRSTYVRSDIGGYLFTSVIFSANPQSVAAGETVNRPTAHPHRPRVVFRNSGPTSRNNHSDETPGE